METFVFVKINKRIDEKNNIFLNSKFWFLIILSSYDRTPYKFFLNSVTWKWLSKYLRSLTH